MPAPLAAIVGVGMACPLGMSSRPALTAVRAGISRFIEVDDFVGPGGAVRASRLIGLGAALSRTERAMVFARHAVQEAVADLDAAEALPCFLALPEPDGRPRIAPGALMNACAGIMTRSGAPLRLDMRPERAVPGGRPGAFKALESAVALLASGDRRYVLVGGLDSLVDAETLAVLADEDRLLGGSNPDGIIPGEGAAFLLLSRPGTGRQRPPLAHILALASADGPRPAARAGERLSAADGLTSAFHRLGAMVEGRVERVYAAVTGETCYGREFMYAYLRNASLMPEPLHHEPISRALGDIGAAAGAACLVWAATQLRAGLRALVYGSSDGGRIGAALVGAS